MWFGMDGTLYVTILKPTGRNWGDVHRICTTFDKSVCVAAAPLKAVHSIWTSGQENKRTTIIHPHNEHIGLLLFLCRRFFPCDRTSMPWFDCRKITRRKMATIVRRFAIFTAKQCFLWRRSWPTKTLHSLFASLLFRDATFSDVQSMVWIAHPKS
jgi:hypothetical protein